MFDTNVFNRILDGVIPPHLLRGRVVAYATHIQRDEINNTRKLTRRAALIDVFRNIVAEGLPTDSLVLGVSRLGAARLSGDRVVPTASAVYGSSTYGEAEYSLRDSLYSALKTRLDSMNRSKANNSQDALIAETSIKRGRVLVTDDTDLASLTREFGGQCFSVGELLSQIGSGEQGDSSFATARLAR